MHWQYVIPGYVIVFGGLAGYIWTLLARIRAVAEQVPEEKRAFLD